MNRAEFDQALAAFDGVMHRMNLEHLAFADGDPKHHVIEVEREIYFTIMQKIMDDFHNQK